MKKAIVFGGSGFLGSHVADTLSQQGYQVSIFDLKHSDYLRPEQMMIVGDILDKEAVKNACLGHDIVYNFAGLADLNQARFEPELTITLNVLGNLNILQGAKNAGARRYVLASTVYVYSESGSYYRASKQASERYTELFAEQHKIPFTILRYGSLYGRRADSRNSIYDFIYKAITQGELCYAGTGDELREYIHVEDAAVASVKILSEEYVNQHLVLTGNQALRVRDLMEMIAEILGDNPKIVFANSDHHAHYKITPYNYRPRIGKKLVMNPFVDIGQGILDCIQEIHQKINTDTLPRRVEPEVAAGRH